MNNLVNRPGITLLGAGVVALVLRIAAGWIPFLGGLLAWILLVFGVFALVGGLWLLVMGSDNALD